LKSREDLDVQKIAFGTAMHIFEVSGSFIRFPVKPANRHDQVRMITKPWLLTGRQ
jgi:hypothetical protein